VRPRPLLSPSQADQQRAIGKFTARLADIENFVILMHTKGGSPLMS
jgi:hypothetical protein